MTEDALRRRLDGKTTEELVALLGWFRTVPEADALRSALLAARFRAAICDEYTLLIDQSLVPAYGGVQLTVPETEAEAARQFLAEATPP